MARPSYLKQVRPSGRWYFQRPIPPDVHPYLGIKSKLWSVSLHTDSESVAERAVIKHIADTDEIIRLARLRADRTAVLSALPASERQQVDRAGGVDALLVDAKRDITSSHYVRNSLGVVDATLDPRQVQHDQLDEVQTMAWLAQLDEMVAGKAAILRKFGVDVPNVPSPKPEKVGLAQALAHYASASQMPPQTQQQYAYAVRRFDELHGALGIDDLSKSHLREFADIIAGLPAAHRTAAASLPVREAVNAATRMKMKTISAPTVLKHVTALKTLGKYAEGTGLAASDPFVGFRLPRVKLKGGKAKPHVSFTKDELSEIVATLERKFSRTSADYWVPLVAIYQGARMEEICQLERSDLGIESGTKIHYMQITDEGAEGKKVKNRASVRRVPIHPHLTSRGFPDVLKEAEGSGYLFSDLVPDQRGRLGGPYGKRFSRFLRKTVGIKDPKKVFHSFRHTWTDLAREAEIPEDMRLALAGRELRGSEAGYGAGYSLTSMEAWLTRITPLAAQ